MIIVTLKGGLGNQMFQYAAGRRLAAKRGTKLKIDASWYTKHQSPDAPALREYELDCFAFKPDFAQRTDLARVSTPPHTVKRRAIRKLAGPIQLIREPETADFMPELLNAPDNSYLEGFWQSEEYFKDAADIIREDFIFKDALTGKNLSMSKRIKSTDSVSLHIRRGDYATHPEFIKVHGMANLDYYYRSIKHLTKSVKNPHFFIISDDPEWCKKNLKLDFDTTYIDHNAKGADDMRLMSMCNHHIIANSSFSWWGAWLDPKKDKLVYAPKKWFNDPKMSTEKRLPESWIKL